MPRPRFPGGSFGSTAAVVTGAIFVALVWAFALERIRYERAAATDEAYARTASFALAYEQQILRTLQAVDQTLRYIRHEYEHERATFDLKHAFREGMINGALFSYAGLVDRRGILVDSSSTGQRLDLSDRDYFAFHREHAEDVLRIGLPMVARGSGRYAIQMTRRMYAADGAFAGVAIVALEPQVLADFQKHLDIGDKGVIALIGLDGVARVRRVGSAISYGHDVRSTRLMESARRTTHGHFISGGNLDGIRRFVSYRSVEGYPLVVTVGLSVDEALAAAASRSKQYSIAATVVSLLITLVIGILAYASRQRQRGEARYRATFDQAAVGMAHAARDGRFLKVNRKLCEMLGYSEEEVLRLGWAEVIHAEDWEASRKLVAQMLSDAAVPSAEHEKRCVRKDGRVVWMVASVSVVRNASGAPDYLVTVLKDVDERKRAEASLRQRNALLRLFIKHVPAAVAMLDRELRYVACSDRFTADFRIGKRDIVGRRCDELFPGFPPRWIEVARRCLAGSIERSDEDCFTRGDGSVQWVRWELHPWRDEDGRIGGVLVFAEEISERIKATAQARTSAARLQQLSKRIVQSLEDERARIAQELHDNIGQALTAVKLNLQAVRRARSASARRIALDDSLGVADEAVEIVRSMSLDLRPRILDELGLSAALEWYCDRQAKRARLPLQYSGIDRAAEAKGPVAVACYRIAQEALTNTLRHARARHASVTLSRRDGQLSLEIADDGRGFDVGAVLSSADPRTALGLAGMEERARLAGGTLAIESRPGRGTRVRAEFGGIAA